MVIALIINYSESLMTELKASEGDSLIRTLFLKPVCSDFEL